MKCSTCKNSVPKHKRDCPSCGADCGYPNVRLASNSVETDALSKRVKDAHESAKARNVESNLEDFGRAVTSSVAVIARPLSVILDVFGNENHSYVSFKRQVDAGMRSPLDNEYDQVRLQYENALFPNFSEDIIFAALSLTPQGISSFGPYNIVLKEEMISNRATVFEENPHVFSEKHALLLKDTIPPGFRANWLQRHELAMAKLHSSITKETTAKDYPDILQFKGDGASGSDWIEVHIYGTINRNAVKSVAGKVPKVRTDRALWDAVIESAASINVEVVEL